MDNQSSAEAGSATESVLQQPPKSNPFKSVGLVIVCMAVGVGMGVAIMFANVGDGKLKRSARKSKNSKYSWIQWLTGSDKAYRSRKKKSIGPFDSVLDPDFDYEVKPVIQTEYSNPDLPSAFN